MENFCVAVWAKVGREEERAAMIERAKKALVFMSCIAFGATFATGLLCWTISTWDDSLVGPLFWIALGFVACAERGN